MPVRMEISRILIHDDRFDQVVELREVEGQRKIPIRIDGYQAAAIKRRFVGETPQRPYTHELLSSVIEALGGRIERVVINDLRTEPDGNSGTFYARLMIRQGENMLDIDSRPSDALALGVATEVPIYAAEHVLDAVSGPSTGV